MYEEIEAIVAGHFNIKTEDFKSVSKNTPRVVTDAKKFLWYILVHILGHNGHTVAENYGVSDRNVYYAVSIIKDGISIQPYYATHYAAIIKELKTKELI